MSESYFLPKGEQAKQEPVQRGKVYGYVRVSTMSQVLGTSVGEQEHLIRQHFNHRLLQEGYTWGGIFVDPGTSAYKLTFAERPAARHLLNTIETGDCLVILRVDRMARALQDAWKTMDFLCNIRKCRVIFLNPSMEFSCNRDPGDISWLWLTFLGHMAEMESQIRSMRKKESVAALARSGHGIFARSKRFERPGDIRPLAQRSTSRYGIRMFGDDKIIKYDIHWRLFKAWRFAMQNVDLGYGMQKWGDHSVRWLDHYRQTGEWRWKPQHKSKRTRDDIFQENAFRRAFFRQKDYMKSAGLLWQMHPVINPPPEHLQDTETTMLIAHLNHHGEIERWELPYQEANHYDLYEFHHIFPFQRWLKREESIVAWQRGMQSTWDRRIDGPFGAKDEHVEECLMKIMGTDAKAKRRMKALAKMAKETGFTLEELDRIFEKPDKPEHRARAIKNAKRSTSSDMAKTGPVQKKFKEQAEKRSKEYQERKKKKLEIGKLGKPVEPVNPGELGKYFKQ